MANDKKKEKDKSLLQSILTFGARDKAAKAKPASFINKDKKSKFKLKKD